MRIIAPAIMLVGAFYSTISDAEQITVVCEGRTITRGAGGVLENQKSWSNESLTFDLDHFGVSHGSEAELTPLTKITDTVFEWRDDGAPKLEGSFSRVTLSGREMLQAFGSTFMNYYDRCVRARPRI